MKIIEEEEKNDGFDTITTKSNKLKVCCITWKIRKRKKKKKK